MATLCRDETAYAAIQACSQLPLGVQCCHIIHLECSRGSQWTARCSTGSNTTHLGTAFRTAAASCMHDCKLAAWMQTRNAVGGGSPLVLHNTLIGVRRCGRSREGSRWGLLRRSGAHARSCMTVTSRRRGSMRWCAWTQQCAGARQF